jgi:hypothetical protein
MGREANRYGGFGQAGPCRVVDPRCCRRITDSYCAESASRRCGARPRTWVDCPRRSASCERKVPPGLGLVDGGVPVGCPAKQRLCQARGNRASSREWSPPQPKVPHRILDRQLDKLGIGPSLMQYITSRLIASARHPGQRRSRDHVRDRTGRSRPACGFPGAHAAGARGPEVARQVAHGIDAIPAATSIYLAIRNCAAYKARWAEVIDAEHAALPFIDTLPPLAVMVDATTQSQERPVPGPA